MTTPIADVPPACAARWQPYHLTEVPPDDILQQEHLPAAPPVQNMTGGAVSDATAELWADANNRDSGWYEWADANDQVALMPHLAAPVLVDNPTEMAVLDSGGRIIQPPCNLYPAGVGLFPIRAEDRAFFAQLRLPIGTSDQYVLVLRTPPGPCSETLERADHSRSSLLDFASAVTVFAPGRLIDDPLLGPIWFSDAGGNCQEVGAPVEWCSQ